MSEQDSGWEKKLLTNLAESSLREQKRSRRWGIFFKLATLSYLIVLFVVLADMSVTTTKTSSKHTALVDLTGMIAEGELASSDNIATALQTDTVQLHEFTLEVDGEMRLYEARITPFLAEEVLSLVRDITDRKQVEKALQESENQLNAF